MTFNLVVDDDTTLNLPSITTGYQLGPTINGSQTDIVTIMTVDAFMPVHPDAAGQPARRPGRRHDRAGRRSVTLPATSLWLTGDTTNDTPPIQVGDLVLFKNPSGMAMQTVTQQGRDAHLFRASTERLVQLQPARRAAGPIMQIKARGRHRHAPGRRSTTLFRVMMITYYVDNTTDAGRAAAGAAGEQLHAAGAGRRRRGSRSRPTTWWTA